MMKRYPKLTIRDEVNTMEGRGVILPPEDESALTGREAPVWLGTVAVEVMVETGKH